MGFTGFTSNILKALFSGDNNVTVFKKGSKPKKKYNVLLFDANSIYYLVDQMIDSENIKHDEDYLNISAMTTVIVLLSIYKAVGDDKNNVRPNILGLFYDGTPPLTKLITQLKRRSVDEQLLKLQNSSTPSASIETLNKKTHSSFIYMSTYIKKVTMLFQCIFSMLEKNSFNFKYYISKNSEPGEGEHKIFEFIDMYKYKSKDKILIVSDDSDVPLFSLIRYMKMNISFLRRSVHQLTNLPNLKVINGSDYNFVISKLLMSIIDLTRDTMVDNSILEWGTYLTKLFSLKPLKTIATKTKRLLHMGENFDILINYKMNLKNLETKKTFKEVDFNIMELDLFRKSLYNPKQQETMTPLLTNCKATLLLILASYIGNDFVASRKGINVSGIYNLIKNIVKNINSLKDFEPYFAKVVKYDNYKKKYYQFMNITLKNHINVFKLLYNTLLNRNIRYKITPFEFYRNYNKGKLLGGPDTYVAKTYRMSNSKMVLTYFQSISYISEYATLGIYGGSKTWFSILPWAPSFEMMTKVISMWEKNSMPEFNQSYSIFNMSFNKLTSNDYYVTDKLIKDVYDAHVSFVYTTGYRSSGTLHPIPCLIEHKNHIEEHLRKFRDQPIVRVPTPIPTNSIITIIGRIKSVQVSSSIVNNLQQTYELSDFLTNLNLETIFYRAESIDTIYNIYNICFNLMYNPNGTITSFLMSPPDDNNVGIKLVVI